MTLHYESEQNRRFARVPPEHLQDIQYEIAEYWKKYANHHKRNHYYYGKRQVPTLPNVEHFLRRLITDRRRNATSALENAATRRDYPLELQGTIRELLLQDTPRSQDNETPPTSDDDDDEQVAAGRKIRKKRKLTVAAAARSRGRRVDVSDDDDDDDIDVQNTSTRSTLVEQQQCPFLRAEAGSTKKTDLCDLFLRNPLEAIPEETRALYWPSCPVPMSHDGFPRKRRECTCYEGSPTPGECTSRATVAGRRYCHYAMDAAFKSQSNSMQTCAG